MRLAAFAVAEGPPGRARSTVADKVKLRFFGTNWLAALVLIEPYAILLIANERSGAVNQTLAPSSQGLVAPCSVVLAWSWVRPVCSAGMRQLPNAWLAVGAASSTRVRAKLWPPRSYTASVAKACRGCLVALSMMTRPLASLVRPVKSQAVMRIWYTPLANWAGSSVAVFRLVSTTLAAALSVLLRVVQLAVLTGAICTR